MIRLPHLFVALSGHGYGHLAQVAPVIDALRRLRDDERPVLIGLGGVDMRLPMENWSAIPGVRWLAPPEWRIRRVDTVSWAALDLPFVDLSLSL